MCSSLVTKTGENIYSYVHNSWITLYTCVCVCVCVCVFVCPSLWANFLPRTYLSVLSSGRKPRVVIVASHSGLDCPCMHFESYTVCGFSLLLLANLDTWERTGTAVRMDSPLFIQRPSSVAHKASYLRGPGLQFSCVTATDTWRSPVTFIECRV